MIRMPKRGPDRKVSDERILLEFVLSSDPVYTASEFEDRFPLTRQQISSRLNEMQDKGYVTSKMASGRRFWWITDEGREFVADRARTKLD